jgi:hypothetical protein
VDAVPITWGSIAPSAAAREDDVRWAAYRARRVAVEKAVRARLLGEEAARRGVAKDEVLRAEVAEKAAHPTDEDVATFWAQNRRELPGTLEASREMILGILGEDARREAEESFYQRLKAAAGVTISQPEPEPVVVSMPAVGPSKGPSSAPVTLVEFGDFECRPCGRMKPAVDAILKSHPDDVRFVFRELPLSVHPHARRAAEAAMAADSLDGFWRYHEILYRHQDALSDPRPLPDTPPRPARSPDALPTRHVAGDATRAAAVVRRTCATPAVSSPAGTPTFFVNGVLRAGSYGPEGCRPPSIERWSGRGEDGPSALIPASAILSASLSRRSHHESDLRGRYRPPALAPRFVRTAIIVLVVLVLS